MTDYFIHNIRFSDQHFVAECKSKDKCREYMCMGVRLLFKVSRSPPPGGGGVPPDPEREGYPQTQMGC